MNDSAPRIVAEKWSWRTLAPWIVLPLVVPIVLVLLAAGYVLYQSAH
jgi:hypothetical protein